MTVRGPSTFEEFASGGDAEHRDSDNRMSRIHLQSANFSHVNPTVEKLNSFLNHRSSGRIVVSERYIRHRTDVASISGPNPPSSRYQEHLWGVALDASPIFPGGPLTAE